MTKKIYFVGPTLNLRNNVGGATIKNENLLNYFKAKEYLVKIIDTDNWKQRLPIIILNLIIMFLSPNKRKIILSTSSGGTYFFLKINYILNIFKKDIYYFVVGGDTPKKIESGIYNQKFYKKCKKIFIETESMKDKMHKFGLIQTSYLPNFKKFKKRSFIEKEYKIPLKSIFFARITPEKGTNIIFEMLNAINKEGKKIEIDFYGPISNEYETEFKKKISENSSVKYKGVLNGQDESVYDVLEKYDIMFLPTFWESEGFPGTVIDSYIAGLPIVASDWNFNSEIIREKETGFLFEAKNQKIFNDIIYGILKEPDQLKIMRKNCYEESEKYNIDRVFENIF